MTLTQIVGKERISSIKGILLIAACLALLLIASAFFSFLFAIGVSDLITSIGFWLTGGILAVWVFYRYVLVYVYTLDGVKLVVQYVFSRKPRFMQQILLREILFIGPPEKAKEKHPKAPVQRAVRKQSPHPETAIVYKRAGETRIFILQPDPEMLSALMESQGK